jgi:RimJ/RimL family protein N-acetyltransferase
MPPVLRKKVLVKNVKLRPTTVADLHFVLAAEADAGNRRFVLQWSREQHEAAVMSPTCAHHIVQDGRRGHKVGYAIILGLAGPHHSIEFRRLVITTKGLGYGRAAVRAIKQFAFETCAAHRLWLDVKDFNHRAKRLYESEGFVTEGFLRECYLGEEGFESVYVMSVLASEYRNAAL